MVAGGACSTAFVSVCLCAIAVAWCLCAIAVACVRSFRGVGLGVAGAFSDRAGVWACAGGVWELYGLSACGVWDGSGVGFVGVVEGGAVFACWGWFIFLLCVGCGGSVMVVWWVEEEFSNTLRQHLTFLTYLGYHGE
jgi:hypothetical protein